ncbi:MAG: DUF805 domain-containing protein [Caulobacteraceae bacterium]|nr:MAG: DUF805 domain-containing protein [Caulobacteraceae bacterium]
MDFNLMFAPLRKYADFNGRARRSEYWLFWLFSTVVSLILTFLGGLIFGAADPSNPFGGANLLSVIWSLGILIPSLAVGVRRLHDTDRSGWWLLIILVPLIGIIVLIIFFVLDGTPGTNKFGPDPKGRGPAEVFS